MSTTDGAPVAQADRDLLEAITGGHFAFRPKAEAERLQLLANHRQQPAADLELIARRIVEWVRAVDDDPDDLAYLNGSDGWNDIRETAAMARRALGLEAPRG